MKSYLLEVTWLVLVLVLVTNQFEYKICIHKDCNCVHKDCVPQEICDCKKLPQEICNCKKVPEPKVPGKKCSCGPDCGCVTCGCNLRLVSKVMKCETP